MVTGVTWQAISFCLLSRSTRGAHFQVVSKYTKRKVTGMKGMVSKSERGLNENMFLLTSVVLVNYNFN